MTFFLAVSVLCFASMLAGCAHSRTQARAPELDLGRTRFETYCAGCHLNEGPFMRGEAPPLEDSSWVRGPEGRIIRIALHGLRGPIEVTGKAYNQEMPGFAPVLTDTDIASLLSYARKRFGGVDSPVLPATVASIRDANRDRKSLWTADELLKVP
jgi:mono/diheme cytochrome c family protein